MRLWTAVAAAPLILTATVSARVSEPAGQVLAFASARSGLCLFEPRVGFADVPVRIVAGDALEFDILVPAACTARAGVEIVFRDGPRSKAPVVEGVGAWRHVRVALDDFVQYESARFELVARGQLADEIGYRVDNVAITHAAGEPSIVFADALPAGSRIVRDDQRQSGAALVDVDAAFDGVRARIDGKRVDEPWHAYDLANLRRASDGALAEQGLFGDVLAGPGVPLRFAERGERASIAARGQKFVFEPLEGGRFYTAWFALSAADGEALAARGFAYGEVGDRLPFEILVPKHGEARVGVTDLGTCTLVPVRIASKTPLLGIEMPSEPRLRIHALTFQWHKDGATDERYQAAWLRDQARTPSAATLGFAEPLMRWADNREIGPSFANDVVDRAGEYQMFTALLRGEVEEFQAALSRETERQAACGAPLKRLRVALEDVRDRRAGVRLDAGADAEGMLRALRDAAAGGEFVLEGDPSLLRQAPQLLSGLGVTTAFLASGPRIARWTGVEGSNVVVYAPFRVLTDARELGDLPWKQWSLAVGMKAAAPELLLAVDGSDRSRADAAAVVKHLAGLECAPSVHSVTDEEFAAKAGATLGAQCPAFTPGPLKPLDDDEARRVTLRAPELRRAADAVAVLSALATPALMDGSPYPRAAIDELRDALHSIDGDDAETAADRIVVRARTELARQLDVLARGADTKGSGTPVVAFNPLPWPRTGMVEIAVDDAQLTRPDGSPLPWQATAHDSRLFALGVPALGYQVVRIGSGDGPVRIEDRDRVVVEAWTARNARVSFTIDPSSGALASLRVAGSDREMLREPARLAGEGWKVESAAFTEKGPLRAVAHVVMTNASGRVDLEFRLEARSQAVEVIAGNAGPATAFRIPGWKPAQHPVFGTPFGSTTATPRADGSPARHAIADWAAWTGEQDGIGILASHLATVIVEDGALAPDLVPAQNTRFALVPFTGGWRAAGLAQRAAEFRTPFVSVGTDAHEGARSPRHSFVKVSRLEGLMKSVEGPECGVAVTAFEPEQDGRTCLVRLVETQGVAGTVALDFDRPVFGAELVDLRGTARRELRVEQRRVELSLNPDRIETVRVRLRP